jgi:hypothetical protein
MGFVSIVDTPYSEMVSAAQNFSGQMYQLRGG